MCFDCHKHFGTLASAKVPLPSACFGCCVISAASPPVIFKKHLESPRVRHEFTRLLFLKQRVGFRGSETSWFLVANSLSSTPGSSNQTSVKVQNTSSRCRQSTWPQTRRLIGPDNCFYQIRRRWIVFGRESSVGRRNRRRVCPRLRFDWCFSDCALPARRIRRSPALKISLKMNQSLYYSEGPQGAWLMIEHCICTS